MKETDERSDGSQPNSAFSLVLISLDPQRLIFHLQRIMKLEATDLVKMLDELAESSSRAEAGDRADPGSGLLRSETHLRTSPPSLLLGRRTVPHADASSGQEALLRGQV